jgi:hypothetical protein
MKLINGERLKHVKRSNGHRGLASDVLTLCTVYKEAWADIEGKTPFTQAELVRIGTLALELVNAVALREQAPLIVGETALIRQRAFTLFVNAYDDARRAVHYLRAKAGDGDQIAPSLYGGRSARRRTNEPEVTTPTPAPVAAAHAASLNLSAEAPAFVIENTSGLPIGHPFTH